MAAINKLIMFHMGVTDMDKSKKFYADMLGMKVTQDYGQGDMHWVSLELPGGGTSINLATALENLKPGTMKLYLSTDDSKAAHRELSDKGAGPGELGDDLYGPGSGVKWFDLHDPDGNRIFVVQQQS